jgi:hypothetical protein
MRRCFLRLAIWMRLPQVSSNTAVVTGPNLGGLLSKADATRRQPLLGRQPATETSPRVLLGSFDERLTQSPVQAGATLRIGSGDVRL